VSDDPCCSNVVVQEQGEEVATVFGSVVALAALLHLEVDGGDLKDEATANSGHGSGQEGGGVSGDGLDKLLDVAVRVDLGNEGHIAVRDADNISPVSGNIELGQEIIDGLSSVDGLVDRNVASTLFHGGELETVGKAASALEALRQDVDWAHGALLNLVSWGHQCLLVAGMVVLEGSHTVLGTNLIKVDGVDCEVVGEALAGVWGHVGLSAGNSDGGDQNEWFLHLLIIIIYNSI
jgi:hypothetical protein